MGTGGIRIILAGVITLAFWLIYGWVLYRFSTFQTADPYEMIKFILRMNGAKVVTFGAFLCTNWLMARSAESEAELDILLHGIYSCIFILVLNLLHYSHLLIMSSQYTLITFIGITIAVFFMILISAYRHGYYKN